MPLVHLLESGKNYVKYISPIGIVGIIRLNSKRFFNEASSAQWLAHNMRPKGEYHIFADFDRADTSIQTRPTLAALPAPGSGYCVESNGAFSVGCKVELPETGTERSE
eukprot:GHVU01043755.1.p2 GENE.GHVU01043755.1~~GHVU01043755.1.p2  ORF type:complete len:108 (+),score=2.28 GHVU01043755.1:215-538(+)